MMDMNSLPVEIIISKTMSYCYECLNGLARRHIICGIRIVGHTNVPSKLVRMSLLELLQPSDSRTILMSFRNLWIHYWYIILKSINDRWAASDKGKAILKIWPRLTISSKSRKWKLDIIMEFHATQRSRTLGYMEMRKRRRLFFTCSWHGQHYTSGGKGI